MKKLSFAVAISLCAACGGGGGNDGSSPQHQELASLGRQIFFDTNLSAPKGMACATCHAPGAAFSDPAHGAVSKGVVVGTRGTRNSPSIMYSSFGPSFHFSDSHKDYVGGQFWDGRAVDTEDQARHPFFGKVEMNLASPEDLRSRIAAAEYAPEFAAMFGSETLANADQTLLAVTQAISAFEHTNEVRPFSSKYDAWISGKAELTSQELRGLRLFKAADKGNCAACHPVGGKGEGDDRPLLTDFTYDNVGLPATSQSAKDVGLAAVTGRASDNGRFKVPTLRNVAVTAPYFHNGSMATLKEAVHFYNARDVDPAFGPPDFPETMNVVELGSLGLTNQEEDDIVAFLGTLTDGYMTK